MCIGYFCITKRNILISCTKNSEPLNSASTNSAKKEHVVAHIAILRFVPLNLQSLNDIFESSIPVISAFEKSTKLIKLLGDSILIVAHFRFALLKSVLTNSF